MSWLRTGLCHCREANTEPYQHCGRPEPGYPCWKSCRTWGAKDSTQRHACQNSGKIQPTMHQQKTPDRVHSAVHGVQSVPWFSVIYYLFSNCWLLSTGCHGFYILFFDSWLSSVRLRAPAALFDLLHAHYDLHKHENSGVVVLNKKFHGLILNSWGNHPPCLYSLSPCPGKVCRTRCWRRIIGCQALLPGRSWIGFGERRHSKKFWRQPARPAWLTSSEWPMTLVSYWFMLWYSCGPLCSGL